MRIFVSYARVDRPFCKQIVETLESGNEVWYDRRLYTGKKWWQQILEQLDWCEGFVYLLSPESVESEYCQKEYTLAVEGGKHIFPVLIQARTKVPADLREIQMADFSEGLTAKAITRLLTGIHRAEVEGLRPRRPAPQEPVAAPVIEVSEGGLAFTAALEAYEAGKLDEAYFKLTQVKEAGYSTRFIQVDELIAEVEAALERQTYEREAEREYGLIAQMVRLATTREQGCTALARFLEEFPDYDPEDLASLCAEESTPEPSITQAAPKAEPGVIDSVPFASDVQVVDTYDVENFLPPPFEWVEIPAGRVTLEDAAKTTFDVQPYMMARYPVTYAQFQVFVDASDGFHNPAWWEGLAAGDRHQRGPDAQRFKYDDHPREHVNWFDAVAFCRWLSAKLSYVVRLPTEWEWQWAAQGPEGRVYPWGDAFDADKCNYLGSNIRQTTPVDRYLAGASPFGVMDMAGNVWEWCLNEYGTPTYAGVGGSAARALRGGSWLSFIDSLRSANRDGDDPGSTVSEEGFRCILLTSAVF